MTERKFAQVRILVARPVHKRLAGLADALSAAKGRNVTHSETIEHLLDENDRMVKMLAELAEAGS